METVPLDASAVVRRAIDLVVEHYVFADVANRLADVLKDGLVAGRYDDADVETLAGLVTADLQSINGDRHLRLVHQVDEIGDMADDDAWLARQAAEAAQTMNGIQRVERLPGNIGLITFCPTLYSTAVIGEAIVAAMRLVFDTGALILDLRELRGGNPNAVALVCTYLLEDESVHLNTLLMRNSERSSQVWTSPWVPGKRYAKHKPIWVLTGPDTFSAGEAIAYDLQKLGRATVVGECTGGGAHVREGFTLHPHLELTVPVMRPISPITDENWEGTGVQPDVPVPSAQALERAHALAVEHLARTDVGPALRRELDAVRVVFANSG
jgi:hypothetical protein